MKFNSINDYPQSGSHIGKMVSVCFSYDTSKLYSGEIIRDDKTEPFLTIIKLHNSEFYVLSTECQYKIDKKEN